MTLLSHCALLIGAGYMQLDDCITIIVLICSDTLVCSHSLSDDDDDDDDDDGDDDDDLLYY